MAEVSLTTRLKYKDTDAEEQHAKKLKLEVPTSKKKLDFNEMFSNNVSNIKPNILP